MAKDVKCKYCKKLKNHWCKAVLDSPDEDLTRECRHFIHKTNADRIRAMSDEELAEWFAEIVSCKLCDRLILCTGNSECKEAYLQWLKSEVKE